MFPACFGQRQCALEFRNIPFKNLRKEITGVIEIRVSFDKNVKYIEDNELTQQEAADRMGVQRSRVGDVCRGHISVFSIDALVAMAARVGLHPLKVAA